MSKFSLWNFDSKTNTTFESLENNLKIETVIIGGGITGITAAARLAKAGKEFCIIETHNIGQGTTGYSTGNLYITVETLYQNIIKKFDYNTAELVYNTRNKAINFIEETINKYNIKCNFKRRPFYFFTNNKAMTSLISNEVSVLLNLGVNIQTIDQLPFSTNFINAAKIDNQARFNPLTYITTLAKHLNSMGCKIYEQTPCININKQGDYYIITTPKGNVKAKKIIIATHLPIGINKHQLLAFPYRSYAIAVKLKDSKYSNGNFWDIDQPGFAISTHNIASENIDILIVSGSSHKTGQPTKNHEQNYQIIQNYIYKHFNVDIIVNQWSAQHYQPSDGLPYIGPISAKEKNILIATGYNADGLTYGTVAGLVLAGLIQDIESKESKIYYSNRFKPLASAKKFLKENINTTLKYLTDYPSNVDTKDLSNVQAGEGKIIEKNGQKFAAYRDKDNKLHVVSAVCTHLKCIVRWNEAEISWDCPCHGSRFNIDGSIIEGPTLCPLKKQNFE